MKIARSLRSGNIMMILFVLLGLLSIVGMTMVTSELTHYRIVQNDKNSQIAMTLAEAGVERGLRIIRNHTTGNLSGSLLVQDGAGLGSGMFDVKSSVGNMTSDVEWTTVGFEGGYNGFNNFENEMYPPLFLGWNSSAVISELNPAARSIYSSVINRRSYFYYRDSSKNVHVRAMDAFSGELDWDVNLGRGRISFGSVVGISGTDRIYFIYDAQLLRNTSGLTEDSGGGYEAAAVHNRPTVVALSKENGAVIWRFPDDDPDYSDPDTNKHYIQGINGTDGDNPLSRPVMDGVLGDTEAVSTALVPVRYTKNDGIEETHLYFNALKRVKLDQFSYCATQNPPNCLSYGGSARGWNGQTGEGGDWFNNIIPGANGLDFDFRTITSGATIDDLRIVFNVSSIANPATPPVVRLTLTENWTQNSVGNNPKPPQLGTSPLSAGGPLNDLGGGVYEFSLYDYGDCGTGVPTICHDSSFPQNTYGLTFVRERSVDGSQITLYMRNDPPLNNAANKSAFAGHIRVTGAAMAEAHWKKQEVMALDENFNVNNPQNSGAGGGQCFGSGDNGLNADGTTRVGDGTPSSDDCEREILRVFHIKDEGSTPNLVWEFPNSPYAGLVTNVRVGNDTQWSKGEIGQISLGRFYTTSASATPANTRRKRLYTMATEVLTYDQGSLGTLVGFSCPTTEGLSKYCPNDGTVNADGKTINDFYPLQRIVAFAIDDEDGDGDWIPDRVRRDGTNTETYTWEYAYDPYELEGSANPYTNTFHPNLTPQTPTGTAINYNYGTFTDATKLARNYWLPFAQTWGQVPVVFKDTSGTARVFITGKSCEQPTSMINCRGQTRGFVITLQDNYEEQTATLGNTPFTELWAYQVHEDEDDSYCFEGTCTNSSTADAFDIDLQQDIFAVDNENFYFTWNNDVDHSAPAVQHIAALRLSDGAEVWNKLFPVFDSGITTHATPAVANGVVYFGITQSNSLANDSSGKIRLYALNAADGSTLDNLVLPDNDSTATPSVGWPTAKVAADPNANYYGFNMSPAIANNAIYVGLYAAGKQRFYGISPDFNIEAIGYYGGSKRAVRVAIDNGVPTFFREGYD